MRRLLDCTFREWEQASKSDRLYAIAASEGRTVVAETIGSIPPLLFDVTNAELAAAMGADILLLNLFDVRHPRIFALPDVAPEEVVREIKRLTGRPVAINLEPADRSRAIAENGAWALTDGRLATPENARRAAEMGIDMIVLTGNPGNGVTNTCVASSLQSIADAVGNDVILAAGKMHASGILEESAESLMTPDEVARFVKAGADILLVPAPGTVPGMTTERVGTMVAEAHALHALVMTTIGTSQEGADEHTIRSIALASKMAGADLHHIGDAGFLGLAVPENIFTYSVAIRGLRHTYRRMARSVLR